MLTRRSASYSRWGGREGYVERCEVGSISYADSLLCVLQYLFNLNLDSAHYDPKTRSMRDNPFVETGVNANE